MLSLDLVACIVALIAGIVAMVTDWRTGQIPNWVTVPALLAGLLINGFSGGVEGFLAALLGAVLCGLVPFLFWRTGAIGGGDVKMLAAVGALLGPFAGLEAELLAFIVGALLAMAKLAWQGKLTRTLMNALRTGFNPILPKKWRGEVKPELMSEFRMGAAILVGISLAVLNRYPLLTSWL